jgi:hypothetical protein
MDSVDQTVGLCATCQWRRTVQGTRSTFYLCERSFSDPRFVRYPPLPVVRCVGYTAQPAEGPPPDKTQ